ncbi:MAG: hypothetical protein SAL07_09555 [Oscillatoria sp. PMC 1051.18]|uniref:hypothetical protein n=1 Tax=Oscillatoria salina TaxID=331517 RepID=UPI0013B66D5B|nr:hypothetical protein [Oscillatoria salina]MBZ8181718.1 hypothetical protein [Oscillatoria salina IIICB1]MEC4892404.1 hypothetical protein [Oscillatoria sp. PMC 1050.18]MEC5030147.1 hypothetical protein [Oscillatoria sp. PMC 1051.18]NET90362.1 hypothetical protein [Kamptonema sp. SIO1D9]
MNQNLDFLYCQLLNWLQEKSVPDRPDRDRLKPSADLAEDWFVEELELDDLDWDESEIRDPANAPPSSAMGEIPTVENRFQALLKRKMQQEIEAHLPLFPWETEIRDYEAELSDEVVNLSVPARQLWHPQLATLRLLMPMPERVLVNLLEACSEAMQLPIPPAAKMVRAVSSLFPERSQALDRLGFVLLSPSLSPSRSSSVEQTQQDLASLLPQNYEAATIEQQIALSLLAAREIVNSLTLNLSPVQTTVERQWQTTAGVVKIRADLAQTSEVGGDFYPGISVRVRLRLPQGGSLNWVSPQASVMAQRTYPGYLCVELFDCQVGQIYPLEIKLRDRASSPLNFAIAVCE